MLFHPHLNPLPSRERKEEKRSSLPWRERVRVRGIKRVHPTLPPVKGEERRKKVLSPLEGES
jgi:hypothetical protein